MDLLGNSSVHIRILIFLTEYQNIKKKGFGAPDVFAFCFQS